MIFYSFLTYMITYFLSWFFRDPVEGEKDPRVKGDKDVKTRTKAEIEQMREKGRLKREENKSMMAKVNSGKRYDED